jgi:hypothetical protein
MSVMGKSRRFRLSYVLVAKALLVSTCGAQAAELPLVRVVLSTAGVGQFTHSGPVAADSTVELAARLDQVDDILKSLTVFDRAGAIGAINLPGKTPLAELFRDLPFGPDALDSPRALLKALVGSEVEIAGQVAAKGRVFSIEDQQIALPNNGGTTTRHRLTLVTDQGGLVQTILEEATALRFSDSLAKAQIERTLAGLSENRAKERRRLSIGFLGEETRNAAISYVVATPVWKTSYRLVLPKDGGKARLQGWAVLENLSGGDWNDINLLLVSGNPAALHQPLYTAVFADRVEVPVAAAARLVPPLDDAGVQVTVRSGQTATMAAPVAKAPSQHAALRQKEEPSAPPMDLGAAANAAEGEEASTQLLYRFPAKISLATGRTMMVPFVDRELPATRTWVYRPETAVRHPLAAVRVRNDGETGLPSGIVTGYEVAGDESVNFVGDGELPLLSKSTSKFVTFALDAKTDIRREDRGVLRTQLGKTMNGTLTLITRSRRTISYEISAPADGDRQIVIEEARADGWRPASEMSGIEETPTQLRYTVAVPKGQTTKATLVLEHTDSQNVTLTTLTAEDILVQIRGLQNESAALKDAVAKLNDIVGDISKARAQRTQHEAERKWIVDEQSRIRQNLQAINRDSDLGRRYLDTLKSQEDRLAEIGRITWTIDSEIAAKRQAAEELARRLVL